MTAIVAIAEKGVVYLGSDAAGVSGLGITVRDDPKSFVVADRFLIGCTTSFRMIQLLMYKLDPPAQTVSQNDYQYMVTSFIDSVRKCFSDNGFGDMQKNIGGTFLVGYKGTLYSVDSDFQVGIPTLQYDSVGCGQDLCLGSLFSTVGKKPEDRIKMALEAAVNFSGGVRPPFLITKLEDDKPKGKVVKKTSVNRKRTKK